MTASPLATWARKLEATADGQPLRASIFIDESYLYNVLMADFKTNRFPWKLTASILAPGFRTVSIRCYTCMPLDAKQRESFMAWARIIEEVPDMEIRLGILQRRDDARVEQKQVDVLLAVDMVLAASQCLTDVIVLVAGDADFVPAVRASRDLGAYVVLWHGSLDSTSLELRSVCDEVHQLGRREVDV